MNIRAIIQATKERVKGSITKGPLDDAQLDAEITGLAKRKALLDKAGKRDELKRSIFATEHPIISGIGKKISANVAAKHKANKKKNDKRLSFDLPEKKKFWED